MFQSKNKSQQRNKKPNSISSFSEILPGGSFWSNNKSVPTSPRKATLDFSSSASSFPSTTSSTSKSPESDIISFSPSLSHLNFQEMSDEQNFSQPPEPSMDDIMKMFMLSQMTGNRSGFNQSAFAQQMNNLTPNKKYNEDDDFEAVDKGQDSGTRAPKDMLKIFNWFDSMCVKTDSEEEEKEHDSDGFTEEWVAKQYTRWVLGAKRMKEEMKQGSKKKRVWFKNADKENDKPAFTVVLGRKDFGVRTDPDEGIMTFPDFLACLTIKAIYEKWATTYAPAPLAANITHSSEAFKSEGWHVIGHSGLPSVANYFYNCSLGSEFKKNPWGPPIGQICILAYLMDEQATGELQGQSNTMTAISRTCGVSADELLYGADFTGWSVAEQVTLAKKTAGSLKDKIQASLKPTRGGTSGRGGFSGRGGGRRTKPGSK